MLAEPYQSLLNRLATDIPASRIITDPLRTLAYGTVLDTRNEDSRNEFLTNRRDMVDGITALARRLKDNPDTVARIRRKYQIKKTTGYSVSALINFDDPIEMIPHLRNQPDDLQRH